MLGTGSGNPAWDNFTPFGDKMAQQLLIFIFDLDARVSAETANLAAMKYSSSFFSSGFGGWHTLLLCGGLGFVGYGCIIGFTALVRLFGTIRPCVGLIVFVGLGRASFNGLFNRLNIRMILE